MANPQIFGPKLWRILNDISYKYDNNEKYDLKESVEIFFEKLISVFPCKYCRESYGIFYEIEPIQEHIDDKTIFVWIYKIHDCVNKKLYKTGISFEIFERRMNIFTQDSYAEDIWDVLFLMTYPTLTEGKPEYERSECLYDFLKSFTNLLILFEGFDCRKTLIRKIFLDKLPNENPKLPFYEWSDFLINCKLEYCKKLNLKELDCKKYTLEKYKKVFSKKIECKTDRYEEKIDDEEKFEEKIDDE